MLICEAVEVDGDTNQFGVLIFGEEILPAAPFNKAIKAVEVQALGIIGPTVQGVSLPFDTLLKRR